MTSKVIFEVENVAMIAGRGPLILVRRIGNTDFNVKPGLELHGREIIGGDIPRALDDEGNPRLDIWGFLLKYEGDKNEFAIGDIVELSQ